MAPHPFYTRGFVLHQEGNAPELIRRAYAYQNAATYLLVKGETDIVADETGILETVDHPSFEAMTAIGGTGDTLTGILTVLCGAGFDPVKAAHLAARANRITGTYAAPNPATQVMELVENIPRALSGLLSDYKKAVT
jgi:NAD(P)H-hydrate repair Nnr-like enzyme with NAD(P)H-hydrate dehydratase domain